jgi:hypothetical protein
MLRAALEACSCREAHLVFANIEEGVHSMTIPPTTISLVDIEALAERMLARGRSRMFADQPNLHADLLLAGNLLTRWIQRGTPLGCRFTLDD